MSQLIDIPRLKAPATSDNTGLVFINCTYDTFTPANSGAIGTWIYEQCGHAQAEGIQPLVISRSSPYPQYSREKTIFLDYPEFQPNRPLRKFYTLQQKFCGYAHPRHKAWCQRVAQAIREAGVEHLPLVLSNDMELAVWLREWFPGAFILHHAQNCNESPAYFRDRFKRSVNVVTACSNFAARWNEQYFGYEKGAIRTIYNGADTERFIPNQDWSQKPLINFVGKTDPIKGPDILLKAAVKLAKTRSDFGLQIVGRRFYDREQEDDYQKELRGLADQLTRCGVDVIFTGWIERQRLPEVLGKAHIHVVPSRWDEPSALTIYEGMSCGMATVGSRTGGTPEIIADAGMLFDRDDVDALADHLEKLISDRALRQHMGQRARQRAEQFSWKRCWHEIRSLCNIPVHA